MFNSRKNSATEDESSILGKKNGETVSSINTFGLGGRDLPKLLNQKTGFSGFIVKRIGAEKARIKCGKVEDYHKTREILNNVEAP